MTDEFVTRAMFDAMVAERDALKHDVERLIECTDPLVKERDALRSTLDSVRAQRDEQQHMRIAGEVANNRLTTQLAAAHGLQARAERAEAALRPLVDAAAKIDSEYEAMHAGQKRERAERGGVGSQHRDRFESWLENLSDAVDAARAALTSLREGASAPAELRHPEDATAQQAAVPS